MLRMRPARIAVTSALLAAAPRAAAKAQPLVRDSLPATLSRSVCHRVLPESAYARVPVFVYGEVVDTLDRNARPVVDLAAQAVARYVRVAVWGSAARAAHEDSAGHLAPADSLLTSGALAGGVRVVARRGGTLTWSTTGPRFANGTAGDTTAARLLARAVASARDSSDFFVSDDLIRGDSLVFDLKHVHQSVTGRNRVLGTVRVRNPAPVFTLPVLWEQEATVVPGTIRPNYPSEMQMRGFEGRVVLGFVIDTAGRAEPATVRDLHPEVLASLAPGLRDAYRQFVRVSRDAILRARFVPAAVGGCPVRQFVQQTIGYTINR